MTAPRADGEPLNIIGHSVGGAAALEAAVAATKAGVKVDNLVTIDPVGRTPNSGSGAAGKWINVTASPQQWNRSDWVAAAGRAIMGTTNTSAADVNASSALHHEQFQMMMGATLADAAVDNSYRDEEP